MSKYLPIQNQSSTKLPFLPVVYGLLQRCTAAQECNDCRKKREGLLQRAAVDSSSVGKVPRIVHEVLRSPSHPLDAVTQAFMEPRFGHDFSGVRVHTDVKAAESARAVNALAYTVGRDLVFGVGQYMPETNKGRKLIAHELAHVVQQNSPLSIPNDHQLLIDHAQSIHETEANQTSDRILEAKLQLGSPNSQLNSHSLMPASRIVRPSLQRWPEPGTTMRSSTSVSPATPDEQRQFAQDAMRFLQDQGEYFASQTNHNIVTHLRHLRTTVENGLAAIASDSAAKNLDIDLRTTYRDAVRATLIARTRTEPDEVAVRTPPTLRELYEQYRDEILPFGLPQADVDRGADELSVVLNAPLPAHPSVRQRHRHAAIQNARQRLRVVTSQVDMSIEELFSTRGARTTIPLPERTTARLSSTIPSSLHHGLRNVASKLMQEHILTSDTTIMLALDLTSFGGGYDAYRFTRLDLGKQGIELMIERQGTIGVESLRAEQRTKLQQRFNRIGFRRGGGFSQDEFDQILIGLADIPETQLSSLRSLRFERQGSDPAHPNAAAHYDQNAHTVRIFDRAFSSGMTRLGRPGHVITFASYSVAHEVGHALDLSSLRTSAAATETAKRALLGEFGTGTSVGGYQVPPLRDPSRARYDELQRNVRTAMTTERAARSRSGARWSGGNPSTVTDTMVRGARQPAFRAAALQDGGRVGRQMPTTYPNPESVWQEYFAESFALYQTSPELLRRLRPNVYLFMEREFPR